MDVDGWMGCVWPGWMDGTTARKEGQKEEKGSGCEESSKEDGGGGVGMLWCDAHG